MATTTHSSVKLLAITSAITFLFSLAIAFNITPLLRGPAPYPPEWQWAYEFTNTLGRIWAPLIGATAIVGTFFLFEKEKHNRTKFPFHVIGHTIFAILLLQISVLFFSRAGIGVLLERIINPGINGYFTTSLSIKDVGEFFSTYQQQVAHFPMRAADHPPFAILFFWVILSISHFLTFLFPIIEKISLHHTDIAIKWNHLLPFQKVAAVLSAGIIPFLSTLVIIPLYLFAKEYYGEKTAIRACFLYSVFPSVSLFLPLNDVFLGLFGMVGLLCIVLANRRKHIVWYILSGVVFCVGAFFSVSLLVPIGIALLIILLSTAETKQKIKGTIGLFAGLSIIPLLLFFLCDFNTITVFIKITSLQAKRSYLPWIFYNLYDFFVFCGVPMLIFSILLIKDLLTHKVTDMFASSFFLVIFILDISGLSRAETGRIWMPYMPFVAVIIAAFLTQQKKLSTKAFAIVLALQVAQILVMQEFWVTLW